MNPDEIQIGTNYLKNTDKKLAKVILASGNCTLKPHNSHFQALIKAIIGQQLSILAADAIYKRFIARFSHKPKPLEILSVSDSDLRLIGLSYSKIKYIKDLSEKVETKQLTFKNINNLTDSQIIEKLIVVKGIGVWSAQMFLIFTLGRLNVLPTGDLGLKKAVQKVYNFSQLPKEDEILILSEKRKWAPYCSLASWYLWRALEL